MSKQAKRRPSQPERCDFAALVRQRAREFWNTPKEQRAAARAARGERKPGRHSAAALFDGVRRGRMHVCRTTLEP